MKNGIQKAGYAVVTQHEVIEAKALTPNTLAQKAELIALMRVMELTQDKTLKIWTDSKVIGHPCPWSHLEREGC